MASQRPRRRKAWVSSPGPFVLLLASLALAEGLVSCGPEAPELVGTEWRLEERPAKESAYESLSVFVNLRDGNPAEDLESIEVVNDAEGLAWKITDLSWTVQKSGADSWIGAADLASADYHALPRGIYRIVVTNLAGQSTESSFSLPPAQAGKPAPTLKSEAGRLRLESTWPKAYLLAYDAAGGLVNARELAPGSYETASLYKAPTLERISSFAAYGYDPQQHHGAYSWRVKR